MLFAGQGFAGRKAMQLAALFTPPYRARRKLARFNDAGFIEATAAISCSELHWGRHVFVGERVTIYQGKDGGGIDIGDEVAIHHDGVIETGVGGSVSVGPYTHIQSHVQISAYKGSVVIGRAAQIAPRCAFYPYAHGVALGELIHRQPLTTKGGIVVDDDAWLGFGVIVLDGVRIGKGAVVGAGSVVTKDVPDYAIAAGVPAAIVSHRNEGGHEISA